MSNTVKVCVRIRPLSDSEFQRGDGLSLYAPNDETVKVITNSSASNTGGAATQVVDTSDFHFDQVFGPDSSQQDVFDKSDIASCCEAALNGCGVTVFTYGQTSSGKTHTLSCPPSSQFIWNAVAAADEKQKEVATMFLHHLNNKQSNVDPQYQKLFESLGLQFRASVHLLRRVQGLLEENPETEQITIRAAMYEIYNEQVNDLLNETQNLKVRLSPSSHTFFVENLMLVTITSLEDLFAVLAQSESSRKRSSHSDSTRSHVIFSLGVERISISGTTGTGDSAPLIGKMNFVDLAGSERLVNSVAFNNLTSGNWYQQQQQNSGDPTVVSAVPSIAQKFGPQNHVVQQHQTELLEARKINQSLHVLGKVISALAANSRNPNPNFANLTHIPFRDSTLTKLLMDSLSGQALTLMIACVSPSSKFVEESRNTLQYATMARSISGYRHVTSNVSARVDAGQNTSASQLRKEVEILRRENASMRKMLIVANEEKQLLKRQLEQALAFNVECASNNNHPSSRQTSLQQQHHDETSPSLSAQGYNQQSFAGEINSSSQNVVAHNNNTITVNEDVAVPELQSKTSVLYVVAPQANATFGSDRSGSAGTNELLSNSLREETALALKRVEQDNASLKSEVEELKRLVLDISRRSAASDTISSVLHHVSSSGQQISPKQTEELLISSKPPQQQQKHEVQPPVATAEIEKKQQNSSEKIPESFYGFIPSSKRRGGQQLAQQQKEISAVVQQTPISQMQSSQQQQQSMMNSSIGRSSSTRALPLSLGSLAFEALNGAA